MKNSLPILLAICCICNFPNLIFSQKVEASKIYPNRIEVQWGGVPCTNIVRSTCPNMSKSTKSDTLNNPRFYFDYDRALLPRVQYFYQIYVGAKPVGSISWGQIVTDFVAQPTPTLPARGMEFMPDRDFVIDLDGQLAATDSLDVQIVPLVKSGDWTSVEGFSFVPAADALVSENIVGNRFSFTAPSNLRGTFVVSMRARGADGASYFSFPDTVRAAIPLAKSLGDAMPRNFKLVNSGRTPAVQFEIPATAAGNFAIEFFFSKDKTLSANDSNFNGLESFNGFFNALPNSLRTEVFTVPLPLDAVPTGDYFIIARVQGRGYSVSETTFRVP